ncbi:NAD(P)-dependent oxidoreductase [Geobacter sp. AOG2]|uniref:NAD-dependent epimerase/dehydratase family protein n=1 Tax=Geobacter sp. AOG2 TaxID=1566347 RepID=UPI001CC646E8|nr:SDR family oxidoreductase [Geobacter sp. AOG2]GFE62136.1 putative UDP-glucose epimerase YtcB [Geobacter sp. AOG2]
MKIVVTGALGHIGSQLIRSLPETFPGAEIIMLDNLSTQRFCSLFNLPAQGRYRFREADILTADLEELFAGALTVVHLAAITNAEGSFDIQEKVEQTNFIGTERVARACASVGAPLLFLSTTSVYGTQAAVVDEQCAPHELKPQSPYAESKLRAEQLLAQVGQEQRLRFIICRFGTIFGASVGMRFHTAVNKFIWQACMGIPLTVWTSALDQQRPYLDLSDAVRAIEFIIGNDLFDGNIYNVLTINATVRQVIDTVREFIPDARVKLVDHRIMNQLSYAVACEKFRSLGFTFKGDLHKRVAESIDILRGACSW